MSKELRMKLYEVKQNDFMYCDGEQLIVTDCNPYLGYIEADSHNPWRRYRFEGKELLKVVTLIDDEPSFDLPKSYQKKWWQFWKDGVQA
jgi:hypothetical protein